MLSHMLLEGAGSSQRPSPIPPLILGRGMGGNNTDKESPALPRNYNNRKRKIKILFGHSSQLAKALEKGKGIPSLLPASEMKVATLIKNGLSTRQVARQLNISEETVKSDPRNIPKKLSIQHKKYFPSRLPPLQMGCGGVSKAALFQMEIQKMS